MLYGEKKNQVSQTQILELLGTKDMDKFIL